MSIDLRHVSTHLSIATVIAVILMMALKYWLPNVETKLFLPLVIVVSLLLAWGVRFICNKLWRKLMNKWKQLREGASP